MMHDGRVSVELDIHAGGISSRIKKVRLLTRAKLMNISDHRSHSEFSKEHTAR
jgi:hypothetical protein